MLKISSWLDSRFYSQYENNWDDEMFRNVINTHLNPEMDILDLGAGAGIVNQMNFKGAVRKVCGVDVDPRVISNPMLDEGRIADAGGIPYPDNSFDLVFSDNVMEHIEEPAKVLSEVARVLKPGGCFLFKTPNRNHYMPLIARLTPHGFHQFVNRLRGRSAVDTFPTRYRCNTPKHVRQFALQAGLFVEDIKLIEGRPEYLRITALTYIVGIIYERVVNAFDCLSRFRIVLIATLRKPMD